jgi:FixJ family two-component response regulator
MTIARPRSIERSAEILSEEENISRLRDCRASLSRREREVLTLVVCGQRNKQVAAELGISEITVKAHRGKVMRKMGARSFAHLVNMAASLGITTGDRVNASRSVDAWPVHKRSAVAVSNTFV